VLDRMLAEHAEDTEDDIAWRLVALIGQEAAAQLRPVYDATGGRKGFLSMQVNPKLYPSARRMLEHARTLVQVAPNVCVKVPATKPGLAAGEELVSEGINVNVTVSFTVSQAVAAAEMIERGLERARAAGRDMVRLHPYVTLMLGRLDDHLGRLVAKQSVSIDPGYVHWAGVAVFKKAREIFRKRGFRGTLLAAAYRHHLHWSQLVGAGIVQSMPYAWWKQFNASDIEVRETLDQPVEPRIVDELTRKFPDFVKAYEEGAIRPEEFVRYGASIHTLNQFIGGYQDLLALVRERMLR
jgi:transaldolase